MLQSKASNKHKNVIQTCHIFDHVITESDNLVLQSYNSESHKYTQQIIRNPTKNKFVDEVKKKYSRIYKKLMF